MHYYAVKQSINEEGFDIKSVIDLKRIRVWKSNTNSVPVKDSQPAVCRHLVNVTDLSPETRENAVNKRRESKQIPEKAIR